MTITNIKIRSFGALVDREFDFAPGANVIEGANESGKTSLAAFIKFALYGLDGKKGSPTEKELYINRATGRADGVMEFTHEGKAYRVERAVGEGTRETKTLVDLETLTPVKFAGEIGEYLFGVPESVFLNTAFVRQSSGNAVDSEEIRNAVANILSSADEKISVEKAQKKLDAARTKLKHKNTVGGRLRELEREIAATEVALTEARTRHAAVISATGDLAQKRASIEKLEAENERYDLTLRLYDDMRALERRAKLEKALGEAKALKTRLDESSASLPSASLRGDAAAARANIAAAEKALADAKAEREALGEARKTRFTGSECDEARASAAAYEARSRSKKRAGIALLITGVDALAAGAALFAFSFAPLEASLSSLVIGVALGVVGAVLMIGAAKAGKALAAICERWGAADMEALLDAIEAERDEMTRESARAREAERSDERIAKAEGELKSAHESAIALYEDNFGGESGENGISSAEALDMIERRVSEAQAAHAAIDAEYRTKVGECRAMDEAMRGADFAAIDERSAKYADGDEWKIAASLDANGRAEVETKRRFNAEKIRALETQCEELKRVAYTTPGETPAEVEERLSALRREKAEGELRFEALELAAATIESCGESIRRDLIPGVVSRASEAFAETTAMRHNRLVVDSEDMTLRASGEDGAFAVDALSTGGADAAYVCLRRALTPALYRREAPPAIYDESFTAIDEDRAERLINMIAADEGQSLIFTCRASDALRAAEMTSPALNVIRM